MTHRVGDLVELRDDAERGLDVLLRVKGILRGGDLVLTHSDPRTIGPDVLVRSDAVREEVFAARAEVLARHPGVRR